MSLRWPAKSPAETLNYSVDWSRFLGSETISSVAWGVQDANGVEVDVSSTPLTVNGLTVNGYTNTSTVATIQLAGGTNNLTYKITCTVTFSGSLTASRTLQLPVRDK